MKKKIDFVPNRFLRSVPNALTLCNSICGFIAILYTLKAYELDKSGQTMNVFYVSAIMIFSAMIFDAMDGFAARLLNAASVHGIQMDSLSDMVTFGVAPAVLVAVMTHSLRQWSLAGWQEVGVYALCCIYLGGAALRLATYNVHAMLEKKSSATFSGLPSPGAAAAICVVVLYAYQENFAIKNLAVILPIYAAVLGLLMVSKIPYIHAAKWLLSMRRNYWRLAAFVICLGCVLCFKATALVIIVTGYVLSGPVLGVYKKFFSAEKAV
jgi:CDP-diacylglycerol--serine O-phosphatidyltransferase